MDWIQNARLALNIDNDALAAHRDGIRLRLSWLASLVFLPFSLLHLYHGNWPLVVMNTVLCTVMASNAWDMQRGRAPLLPFWILSCLMIAACSLSVWYQGSFGVFWSYPAMFMLFFVLPRRQAMALGLVLLVAMTGLSTVSLGAPVAARVLMSLSFTLVMIHIALNVIGQLQQALVTQAITDPLTGAFNRRHLQSHLVALAAPTPAQPLTAEPAEPIAYALLLIDIDHFKRINDTHGHDAGDLALCRLVGVINARKRGTDLLFRTGGEEFVLLLPTSSPAAALRLAEDLRLRLAEAELLPGEQVTVSIGLSALARGQTAEAWVKAADTALYAAKRQGRNRVVLAEAVVD